MQIVGQVVAAAHGRLHPRQIGFHAALEVEEVNVIGIRGKFLERELAEVAKQFELLFVAEFERQLEWMKHALNLAEKNQIEIDMETTLSPFALACFLEKLPHPLLKVNYDIGNSAGMGYDIKDEFSAYGHRIGSVHIKDKLLNGPTVALGTGIADFQLLADCLENINFTGDIVLEAARGISGEELTWAKNNRSLVLKYFVRSGT